MGSTIPGGGREGPGSESGSVCVDLALSHGLSPPLQGDVCSPRRDSNVTGSPVLLTMSRSEQERAVPCGARCPPRLLQNRPPQGPEKRARPLHRAAPHLPESERPSSLPSSHAGKAVQPRSYLFISPPAYNDGDRSYLSSCPCPAPC